LLQEDLYRLTGRATSLCLIVREPRMEFDTEGSEDMRFHLRRFADAARRTGAWCVLFGRRLRHALKSRFVLAPAFCIISLWLYSHYITGVNFFIIYEEDRVTVHRTYTSDRDAALAEAGIFLGANDLVSFSRGEAAGGRSSEIQITRTSQVTVTIGGVTVPISSFGGTVADALEKAGYVEDVRDNVRDIITPALDTPIEDGMVITVKRLVFLSESYREEIPYETVEQSSTLVNYGASVVTVEGETGLREWVEEVIICDGVEIYRSSPEYKVLRDPVTQIVVKGTGGTIRMADGTHRRYTRRLEIVATAYTTERQVNKINAIGNIARVGTIAVDPRVIPLRIDVYVTSRNGSWHYGFARTEDTGGKIKGNIIDLYFDTWNECIQFGRRSGYLYILS
jgi:3D (Asp-Asp-Asp) domain-containing protein